MVKYDDTDDRIREIVRSMALSKYKSFYLEHNLKLHYIEHLRIES